MAGLPCAAGLLCAGLSHRWVQSSGTQPAALVLHRHFYVARVVINFPSRSLGCCSGTSDNAHLHQECSSLWSVSLGREWSTAVTLQQKRSHSELTAPCNRQSREESLTEEFVIYMTAKPPGFFFLSFLLCDSFHSSIEMLLFCWRNVDKEECCLTARSRAAEFSIMSNAIHYFRFISALTCNIWFYV